MWTANITKTKIMSNIADLSHHSTANDRNAQTKKTSEEPASSNPIPLAHTPEVFRSLSV
jgi:hypothetical protein